MKHMQCDFATSLIVTAEVASIAPGAPTFMLLETDPSYVSRHGNEACSLMFRKAICDAVTLDKT